MRPSPVRAWTRFVSLIRFRVGSAMLPEDFDGTPAALPLDQQGDDQGAAPAPAPAGPGPRRRVLGKAQVLLLAAEGELLSRSAAGTPPRTIWSAPGRTVPPPRRAAHHVEDFRELLKKEKKRGESLSIRRFAESARRSRGSTAPTIPVAAAARKLEEEGIR